MKAGILEFDTEIVYGTDYIQKKISELSVRIKNDLFWGTESTWLYVCIMNGAVQFFKDITSLLPSGYCQYITASSYHDNKRSETVDIQLVHLPRNEDFKVDRIMIFDDICDSGSTLKEVVKLYQNHYPVAAIHTVVLIHRIHDKAIYMPNYSAIQTKSEEWFGGYGLDNKGWDRNLPYIYSIPQEL